MSIEKLVDQMIKFEKTGNTVTWKGGDLGPVARGDVGVLTLTAPLNTRTGDYEQFSMTCTEKQAEQLRSWFENLFHAAGDDIALRFHLERAAPSGGESNTAIMHGDRILGPLRYSLPRGG